MKKSIKEKRGQFWCVILAILLLVLGIPVLSAALGSDAGTETVEAATTYVTVRFWDNDGKTSYADLRLKVKAGGSVELPSVPAVSGYTSLGWSNTKGATTAAYKSGQTIKVKTSTRLYAVRSKNVYYKALFYSNKGKTSAAYEKLAKKVKKGSYLALPEVPELIGYQALGWSKEKGAATAAYPVGKKIKLTKSTKFYAVYKKCTTYTVSFYTSDGKSSSAYSVLNKKVNVNSYITLPSVPEQEGYIGLGWSAVMGSSSSIYKAGAQYKVKKNLKFYAVQETAATVTLCKNNGTVYKTLNIGKGNYLSLPSVKNASGYTFMGWAAQPGLSVMKNAPGYYEAGEKLMINDNITLYAVVFNRSNEPDLTATDLLEANIWSQKYKQVIFVGDSRTERMQATLEKAFGTSSTLTRNVHFVAKSGMGLSWLKSEGNNQLLEIVNQNNSLQKPTAVIFNLGINDLASLPGYISFMNEIAPVLKEKNCKLFYMSVNPVNSKMNAKTNHTVRAEADVRDFNGFIKNSLQDTYTFIDTYSMLMQEGFGTDAGINGVDSGVDDGLHYTTRTYKRIYKYCLDFLLNYGELQPDL